MNSLADSSAYFDDSRSLTQHQAALTLLQGMLSDPDCESLNWLDLACGKGQIISQIDQNLSPHARSKINLLGYDIENSHSKHAKRIAEAMSLASFGFEVGSLNRFWENASTEGPWHFITLTNTTHELSPESLAEVLSRAIERLDKDGCLFLYDMEQLPTPELGAIPWSAGEIRRILKVICESLGAHAFEPEVGTWAHHTCKGWNAQVRRRHMRLPPEISGNITKSISATSSLIRELLHKRLERVNTALEGLTEYGAATAGEHTETVALLYEHWAISRSLREK